MMIVLNSRLYWFVLTLVLWTSTYSAPAMGQSSDFYVGAANSFYHIPSSWQDGSPATAFDDAFFDMANNYTVFWSDATGNTTSRSATVRNGNVTFSQTNLPPVLTHTVLNDLTIESGELTVSRHILNINESIDISTRMAVRNGAEVNAFSALETSPNSGDSSVLTVEDANTVLSAAAGIVIGQRGPSSATIQDAAVLMTPDDLLVGFPPLGGSGNLVVTADGQVLADQSINVSRGFSSMCVIGGQASTTDARVSGDGFLVLSDPGAALMAANLSLGSGNGDATMFVVNEAVADSGASIVGEFLNSSGVMNVSDSGSEWRNSAPFRIGSVGQGCLNVERGGLAQSLSGISVIGEFASGVGKVLVTNPDSRFVCLNLDVGRTGTGTLTISDGANVDSTDCFIGLGDSTGTVEINGSGSRYTTGTVRNEGLIEVLGGGQLECSLMDIMPAGEVLLSGNGSLIESTSSATIVEGRLNIQDGAQFISAANVVVEPMGILELNQDLPRLDVNGQIQNEGEVRATGSQGQIFGNVLNIERLCKSGAGGLSIFGDLTSLAATIEVSSSGSIAVHGAFSCDHMVEGTGATFLLGDFKPGGDSIGNVFFEGELQLRPTSTLTIQIGGTEDVEFDSFFADGGFAMQGGQLAVEFIDGFSPSPGDAFLISQGNGNSGTFSQLAEGATVAQFGDLELTITYQAGDGDDVQLMVVDGLIIGDVNLDGVVNLLDVAPFVKLLATGAFQEEADINQDGFVDLLDVAGFVDILSSSP